MTVRRVKSYTGQTGYVYQYYLVGSRPAPNDAVEYVFDVTSDRKTMFEVAVLVRADALAFWAAAHGRALSATEHYAAAKMRLFQAFDEIPNLKQDGTHLEVTPDNIDEVLSPLDLA